MQPRYDISIVLNTHAEDAYLEKTLRSLEQAAEVARRSGATVELVAVLDRPSEGVKKIFSRYGNAVFASFQMIIVDHGSLGLSRNAGIDIAHGEYISVADGDDLVSPNFFVEHLKVCRELGPYVIGVPQYLVSFGEEAYLGEYFSMSAITTMQFFADHPYISKVFFWRGLRDHIRYRDTARGTGYCFEDWHFNAEAVAAGFVFQRVPDTILFYRRRSSGLAKQSMAHRAGVMPPSKLFVPRRYVRAALRDVNAATELPKPTFARGERMATIQADAKIKSMVEVARRLEPEIPPLAALADVELWTNLGVPEAEGIRYFDICREFGSSVLTDVVIDLSQPPSRRLPQLIRGLRRSGRSESRLAITNSPRHIRAPCESVNLYSAEAGPGANQWLSLLRLLQHIEGAERFHFLQSEAACDFLKTYGDLLGPRCILHMHGGTTPDQHAPSTQGAAVVVEPRGDGFRVLEKSGPSGGPCLRRAKTLGDALDMIARPETSITAEFVARHPAARGRISSSINAPAQRARRVSLLGSARFGPRFRRERSLRHMPRDASRAIRRWIGRK